MRAGVTYRVDYQNSAFAWWDAFRAALPALRDADPEVFELCRRIERLGEVSIPDPAAARRFAAFVTGLPGFQDGPRYARSALTLHGG
jgi:hypothetical protein